jgi:phage terminase large subunit-like protein
VAAMLDLGKPDKIEQGRAKWTTWSNVNIWFDSLKDFFTSEGFATTKTDTTENNINVLYLTSLARLNSVKAKKKESATLTKVLSFWITLHATMAVVQL